MRVTCLICLISIPLALSAQDRYGTPVVALSIQGASASLLENFPVTPGTLLTRTLVRSAIQTLYDRGGYTRIEVEAIASGEGTELVFHVDAPYFFSTVRVEPRRLLERSLSSYISLPYGERFSISRLEGIVDDVRGRLEAEGYFAAEITPTYTRDEDTRLVVAVLGVEAGPPARVGEIQFEGGEQTFDRSELADAFDVSGGSRFLEDNVLDGEDRLRTLFANLEGRAGYLDTLVEVVRPWNPDTNTVDLVVRIEPGSYAYVQLTGANLSDARLRELVPVFEERSVDADLIEEGRISLLEHFIREGYFNVMVTTPDEPIETPIDPTTPEAGVAVQIDYDVDTGLRHLVETVRVTGNTYFDDRTIRGQLGISSKGVFSRGVFSPELLEQAADTVRGMYRAAGLAETEVVASSEVVRNAITVDIDVREGPQLTVTGIDVVGNAALTREEVTQAGGLVDGAAYRPSELETGRRAVAAVYHRRGYADVRVSTAVSRSDSGNGVRITLGVEEGERFEIGQIVVSGNTRTRTTVVRRHAEPLAEAVPFNPEVVLEAQRNLYATGLFSRVDIVPLDQDQDGRRDILIQIEEAGPLLLSYGIGVQEQEGSGSSVDVRGTVELVHSNLWGLDRSLSVRVQGSKREQRFQTTYREPQLFNWDLDGFASLFVERAQRPQFDASRIDFSLQTLYPLSDRDDLPDHDNLLFSASFETVNLKDIRVNPRAGITDEEGNIQVATIGLSYVRDRRDDPINATRGSYFLGTLRVGNRAYGSEVNFTSFFTQFSVYRPAKAAVIAASARFGWNQPYGTTTSLPITERYFAGGSTTLRAFGLDEAGPQGGGNALFLMNAEYRHPIPFMMSELRGALFYDTGTIFPELSDFTVGDFTHTGGFGLRYETPLGPVRVDLGVNLNRQPPRFPEDSGERTYKLHFTLGHAF